MNDILLFVIFQFLVHCGYCGTS